MLLIVWLSNLPAVSALDSLKLRSVALSGQPPAGTLAPESFQRFDVAPIINDVGQTAFFAAPALYPDVPFAGNTSVWSERNGELHLVVRRGDSAPGLGAEVEFKEFFDLALNNSGQTAFRSHLAGSSVVVGTRDSIWMEADVVASRVERDGAAHVTGAAKSAGGLQLVLRQGEIAPGTVDRARVATIVDPFAFNDAGQIAVSLEVNGNSGTEPVTAGLWSGSHGALAPVARDGMLAPGADPGVTFVSQGFVPPFSEQTRINASGQVGFQGFLAGPGINLENHGGIWLSSVTGSPELIARNGELAPGTDGLRFLGVTSRPNINAAGHVNFLAFLEAVPSVTQRNRIGMWSTRSGELQLVIRLGDAAPGAGPAVSFLDLQSPVISTDGSVAFGAVLAGPGIEAGNDTGIWSEGQAGVGDLELVARAGEAAPGTPPGVRFANFLDPVINTTGQIAFQAILSGPNVAEQQGNLRGLWAQNRRGDLSLIAREGDQIEVASGDVRTIDFLLFASGVGSEEGRPSGFNSRGEVAFHARFTDGSGGIFVSRAVAIPEPSTFTLTLAVGCFIVGAVSFRFG